MQMATSGKNLSPAQVSYYRQQSMMRGQPQQRIGIRDPAQVKVVPGQAKVAQVASVQPVSPSQPKPQVITFPDFWVEWTSPASKSIVLTKTVDFRLNI